MNLTELFALVDEALVSVHAKTAEMGRPVTCTRGCFHCCKEPVLAARLEVEEIIASLTAEQLEYVRERTIRWVAQIRASRLLDSALPHVFLWRAAQAWCPLLKDGECMAYEKRPLGCRTHIATGPVSRCEDDQQRLYQEYALPQGLGEQASALMATMPGGGVLDNLGVWLADLLLNRERKMHPSGAAVNINLVDPE